MRDKGVGVQGSMEAKSEDNTVLSQAHGVSTGAEWAQVVGKLPCKAFDAGPALKAQRQIRSAKGAGEGAGDSDPEPGWWGGGEGTAPGRRRAVRLASGEPGLWQAHA